MKINLTEDEMLFLKEFMHNSISSISVFDPNHQNIPKARELLRKIIYACAFPGENE